MTIAHVVSDERVDGLQVFTPLMAASWLVTRIERKAYTKDWVSPAVNCCSQKCDREVTSCHQCLEG
jgi:hypothetical protein